MKNSLLALFLIVLGSFPAFSQSPSDTTVITVEADTIIGEVSPFVYGANYGPLQSISPELINEAFNSGIQLLRFPGGRWGDINDIRTSQLDSFMRFADQLGAEVIVSVRLENGTPEQAVNLVRHALDRGHEITYWSIGNEPNLFENYTTEDLNREWREIAEAMLAENPDIVLIGPDISQYPPEPLRDDLELEWVSEFLKVNGDLVDVLAVHRYPFPLSMTNPVTSIEDLRENVYEWDDILDRLRQISIDVLGYALPVAMTEANSHWSSNIAGEATPDSHYNAIWWADVLGRLIVQEPFAVNYFDFQSGTGRGGWGLLANYEVRPTYYTYQLYKQFGDQLHAVTVEGDDLLSAYASTRADGALTVLVVNRGDDPQPLTVNIAGFDGATAEWVVLDLEHNAASLGMVALEDGLTVTGQSANLLIVQPE